MSICLQGLTLHQFLSLFLDILISQVLTFQVILTWRFETCGCFLYPSGRGNVFKWSFFSSYLGCVLYNENTFWFLENASWAALSAVKSSLCEPAPLGLEFQKNKPVTCLQVSFCLFRLLSSEFLTDGAIQG